MAEALIDALVRMNGFKGDGQEARIYNPKRKAWLSGAPYLWSGFAERAYVFPSAAQANELIVNFADELGGCQVKVRS